ncbi:hypothetical protein Cgig2_031313 [Carnegiea gigantea]|uniref:Remorin C-terminal domain-containing protein n=1 Tax=Carnegiea gigantea TaxID=171969 RepID=A0A9Q1QMG4_9CARY|nr:hypothetical protein Cgig2_031313 [Carnegiea gigantea]
MEALITRARSRFSRREEPGEGRIPSQKTASFKGDRRPHKWFRRQLSGQMSLNESGEDVEFAAAVAAAAFAITSLESDDVNERKMKGPESTPSMVELGETSKSSADAETNEITPEKTIHPVPSIKKKPSALKKRLTFAVEVPEDAQGSFTERPPSVKKTPSFWEEPSEEDAGSVKPPQRSPTVTEAPTFDEGGFADPRRMKPADSMPPPILPPAVPPLHIQQPTKGERRRDQETDADVWEREEMAKIEERDVKLRQTIHGWEKKKMTKARQKLETTESEVEKRRAKAVQKYQTEMEQIQQIADGARAQAKEKQRTDRSKTTDKANRYKELLATIHEWEEKKKQKATRKLRMTEVELENKKAKARQRYQIEMEQIREITNGARAQVTEKMRNEELKVKEKANRYRETGKKPLPPLCQCL